MSISPSNALDPCDTPEYHEAMRKGKGRTKLDAIESEKWRTARDKKRAEEALSNKLKRQEERGRIGREGLKRRSALPALHQQMEGLDCQLQPQRNPMHWASFAFFEMSDSLAIVLSLWSEPNLARVSTLIVATESVASVPANTAPVFIKSEV
ncbi:MAG: hypothetical protein O2782_15265 [bacterium]|nr:hypothetical protein [bacterium]